MLIVSERPSKFSEVQGCKLPVAILTEIAKNPSTSPKSLILAGEHGTGKTTTARIFAKAVNCETRTGDACNECPSCISISQNLSSSYLEFDSSAMGNVDAIRTLKDNIMYGFEGIRVIVFDESHLITKQAMSSLLTTLESLPDNLFFVFPTTELDKILNTIISRSLVLRYEKFDSELMFKFLNLVSQKNKIVCSDKAIRIASNRSFGHPRDGLQQLELIKLLGESEYLKKHGVLYNLFPTLLRAYEMDDFVSVSTITAEILQYPCVYIESDYYTFIKSLADKVFTESNLDFQKYTEVIYYSLRYLRYLRNSNDWYIFLRSLKSHIKKKNNTVMGSQRSRFQKR